MIVLGIDPSDTIHAWAAYDSTAHRVIAHGRDYENDTAADAVRADLVAIEMVACYGMTAGASLFDTCVEIGRLIAPMERPRRITRSEVKLAICGQSRAKDSNVRTALMDLWGGKEATKKGGPLHGIAKDVWAALAVAIAASRPTPRWYETAAEKRARK